VNQAVDFGRGVEDAWSTVAAFVPKLAVGGGIRPMQERWQRTLTRYDQERPRIAQQARLAPSVGAQAREPYQQARPDQPTRSDLPGGSDPYGGRYPTEGATAVQDQCADG